MQWESDHWPQETYMIRNVMQYFYLTLSPTKTFYPNFQTHLSPNDQSHKSYSHLIQTPQYTIQSRMYTFLFRMVYCVYVGYNKRE